jgi:type I restriction enzyme S subunit
MLSNWHQEYLSRLPIDWEIVPLSELGVVYSGSTPSRTEPKLWNGEIAWVTPREITELRDKWLTSTRETITNVALGGSATKLLPKGTLLVTTRATVGAIAIAAIPVTTNQGFKSIVPNPRTDATFYYYLLQFVAREMTRRASGSTFVKYRDENFLVSRFPVPLSLNSVSLPRDSTP